jgi:hypothetical protein
MCSYKKACAEGLQTVMHTWMEDVRDGFDNE